MVTQFSYTHQDTTTEAADTKNPNFELLPDTYIDSTTGSIGYTKDLGSDLGRLSLVRVSESTNDEIDKYELVYRQQPGVQGNTHKTEQVVSLTSTYDAPSKLFFIPLGTNQFTETYTLTHDSQGFFDALPGSAAATLSNYDRTTVNQVYGWSNTTEVFKNLVFTPGYTLTMVDAVGNTNSAGNAAAVAQYESFQDRYQPKGGLVYRGIPGLTPSVDYSGSVQYDYISFPLPQFTNANSLNFLVNMTPASWLPFFQKMNLTLDAGRTESSNATINSVSAAPNQFQADPNKPGVGLTTDQMWLISKPTTIDFVGTETITDRLNADFKILDWWDMRPTGSWGQTYSVVALGTFPTEQDSQTYGFTTVWSKKILTVPLINVNLNSVQFQFTETNNAQYDSSAVHALFNQTKSDVYSLTLPYDIDKGAQEISACR